MCGLARFQRLLFGVPLLTLLESVYALPVRISTEAVSGSLAGALDSYVPFNYKNVVRSGSHGTRQHTNTLIKTNQTFPNVPKLKKKEEYGFLEGPGGPEEAVGYFDFERFHQDNSKQNHSELTSCISPDCAQLPASRQIALDSGNPANVAFRETLTVEDEYRDTVIPVGESCSPRVVEERLARGGVHLTLADEHFAIDFEHGLNINALPFDIEKATHTLYHPQAISKTPVYRPKGDLIMVLDIDDKSLDDDVRLIHLVARQAVCGDDDEEKCSISYQLPAIPLADPPHRILALNFHSPRGKTFQMAPFLKQIQMHPFDMDLRRISLARVIEEQKSFFQDEYHKLPSPSWNIFKVYNEGTVIPASRHRFGVQLISTGHPLIAVKDSASSEEIKEALKEAQRENAELDGISTPTFGGVSPASNVRPKSSGLVEYLFGCLLIIGVVVGMTIIVSDCVVGAQKPS